jgi:sugar phosphate isomerase/epimerase
MASRSSSITTDMFNYTFRPSMDEKLAMFRRHGFRYVHWCDNWNNERYYSRADIDGLGEKLAAAGLACIDVHGTGTRRARIDAADPAGHNLYIRLLKNRIEFCAAVGGDAVVIHPPDPNPRTDWVGRDRLRRAAGALGAVRDLCERKGVRIAVENMGHRSPYGINILSWFFERYPTEFVGWCFDCGHANVAGNAKQLQAAFGDRLIALHLHDNHGQKDEHQPPFYGTIDWPSTMRFIDSTDYAKPINFEITHRTEHFTGTMPQYIRCARAAVTRAMKLFG